MFHLSDEAFEAQYRKFLTVRDEWQVIVRTLSVYNDESHEGMPVRHIGMTSDKGTITRTRDLLLQWEQFAALADSKRAAGIHVCTPSIYSPVPVIVDDFTSFSINEFSATSVAKIRREEILSKINKRIASAKRNKGKLATPYNIEDLERDVEVFQHYPEGTIFRMRIGGYMDVFVDFFHAEGRESRRERIGQFGILIDSTKAQKACKDKPFWGINNGSKIQYPSVYDSLKPIRCGIYSNCELYLLDEVEKAKKLSKESVRLKHKKRARERYHEKSPGINLTS